MTFALPSAPKTAPHILLVEDDLEISRSLSHSLAECGFTISCAASATAMDPASHKHKVDLVLLDIMLPGEDGLSICRRIRMTQAIPIIMLTALSEEMERVVGLEVGADDYIGKPFSTRELIARIRALLRRSGGDQRFSLASSQVLVFDGWEIDPATRQVRSPRGVHVQLTSAEFDLLARLLPQSQSRAVSRAAPGADPWRACGADRAKRRRACEPHQAEDRARSSRSRTDQDRPARGLHFHGEGLGQMKVSPEVLLPRTICWQIIAFAALSLVLGNAITFGILSHQFRTEQRLHQEETVAAIITTFAGLLAPAETPSEFSKLVAQGRAIGIAVQEVPKAQLATQRIDQGEYQGFAKALAEMSEGESGFTVLSEQDRGEPDGSSLPRQAVERPHPVVHAAERRGPCRRSSAGPPLLTASIGMVFVLHAVDLCAVVDHLPAFAVRDRGRGVSGARSRTASRCAKKGRARSPRWRTS